MILPLIVYLQVLGFRCYLYYKLHESCTYFGTWHFATRILHTVHESSCRVKVGLQAFEKLKPYYVKRLKECNTCTCKYHTKMVELQHGFKNMQISSKGAPGRTSNCDCDICCSKTLRHCIAK